MSAAKHNQRLALALLIAVGLTISSPTRAGDKPWTLHDLDTVTDAAMVAFSAMNSKTMQASSLVQLSDALIKAGDSTRAKEVLGRASAMLGPTDDAISSFARQNIVRSLVVLGDVSAAEKLTNLDTALPAKAALLGEFGKGQAQRGNVVGAQKKAAEIAALGASADVVMAASSVLAQRTIAVALADAGAINEAVRIADGLDDKSAAAVIQARAARTLCSADDAVKGRALAKRAAENARAAAATVDKPFQMFEPIQDAAKALTVCQGVAAAAAFVRDAIPSQAKEETRSALIDRLSDSGQAAVAVAVASPPKAGDVAGFLALSNRLKNNGDLAAAKAAAIQASQIATNQSTTLPAQYKTELRRIVGLLASLSTYDAAIAAIGPLPVAERASFYMMLVDAAVKQHDSAGLGLLLPQMMAVLNSMDSNRNMQAVTRFQLARLLVIGGYSTEARPLTETLLAPPSDSAAPQNAVVAIEAAKLKADMGDVSGALQAANALAPLVAPPSQQLIALAAVMQFDGRASPPTSDEVKAAMERSKTALPAEIAGPRAHALSAVAMELAGRGNIAGALTAEAELEVEPRAVLAGVHDAALAAIADGQAKLGDLEGALSTTLKITQDFPRWAGLLKLAAKPPTL